MEQQNKTHVQADAAEWVICDTQAVCDGDGHHGLPSLNGLLCHQPSAQRSHTASGQAQLLSRQLLQLGCLILGLLMAC
jgi:hypothetical protein